MKFFVSIIVLMMLLTGCAKGEEKTAISKTSVQKVVPVIDEVKVDENATPGLQNRGALLSFQYAGESNLLKPEELKQISDKLDSLIATMKVSDHREPIGTDDFFVATYSGIKLYLLPGNENPEKNIIVKSGNQMDIYEGDKSKIDAILEWTETVNPNA